MGKLNNLQLPDETTTGQSRVAKTTNEEKLGNGLLPGADADIMDFITVRKSSKREAVSVYFDEDVMDKLKTISEQTNVAISKMIEQSIEGLTKNIEADQNLVKQYNKKKKK